MKSVFSNLTYYCRFGDCYISAAARVNPLVVATAVQRARCCTAAQKKKQTKKKLAAQDKCMLFIQHQLLARWSVVEHYPAFILYMVYSRIGLFDWWGHNCLLKCARGAWSSSRGMKGFGGPTRRNNNMGYVEKVLL